MVRVPASVDLPLNPLHHKVQKFSSGTGSPGWSRKKGRKTAVVWFVNTIHSVYFHFINTIVIYEFTALLKFTYSVHTDLLK